MIHRPRGWLEKIIKGRSANTVYKRGLRNSVYNPASTDVVCIRVVDVEQAEVGVMEEKESYLRATCSVIRWDGEWDENVYERRGVSVKAAERVGREGDA